MLETLLSKKIIIVTGHYGSGKTNLAVELALQLAARHRAVAMADMDIVNPYFRAADSADKLQKSGIRCILPAFANSNVDIPALPPELYALFDPNNKEIAVLDVGGDDAGATALGMYRRHIAALPYEMLYVINCYRPLTPTPEETVEIMREIEYASGLKCTAIVNNSNLGAESDAEGFLSSFDYAEKTAALAGLPLLCHTTALPGIDTPNVLKIENHIQPIYGGNL